MRHRTLVLPLAALVLVGGCATMPSGPSVMVLPGTQKSFPVFQNDQQACQQYAYASIGGAATDDAAANAAVGNAVAGAALGAAVGAILGSVTGNAGAGAAWGAGTGLLFGGTAGANAANMTYYEAQRRYDMAYVQCMYARGNQVPGRTAYSAPPSPQRAPAYPPPNYPPPQVAPSHGSAPTSAPRVAAPVGYPAPNQPPPGPAQPSTGYPPPDTPPPAGLAPVRG